MIQQQLWRRLEAVRTKHRSRHVQRPFVFVEGGETTQDMEAKIERWKAGATGTGISGVYEGGDVELSIPFGFMSLPRRE